MPDQSKRVNLPGLSTGSILLSLAASIIPMVLFPWLAMSLFHLAVPQHMESLPIGLVPILLLMPGATFRPREDKWVLRFAVFALGQCAGLSLMVILANMVGDLTQFWPYAAATYPSVLLAVMIPLFITEDPKRANPEIDERLRRRQLVSVLSAISIIVPLHFAVSRLIGL